MQMDRMVRVYRKIRDARAELKAEFDAKDKELKEKLATLEQEFMAQMNEIGSDSIKTPDGVVFRQVSTKATISDSSVFFPWVREHDAFDMLQKRVTIKSVTDYIEDNGEAPPGISVHREHEIRVRKS